jgi:thiamine pyrophosphate-dependent acetolactate synthase large subunit-like protein
MADIYWLRQTKDQPAFPDVLWSRPENKRHAGKLLIVGGHAQSFSTASRAFAAALKAGAGHVRIVLPDSLQKTVGKAFPEAEFASSTPIGSFSRQALALLIDLASWSDTVLLAGDFGKNSETSVALESFIEKYSGPLALAGDSLDYFFQESQQITKRENTLIIGDLSQIQKIAQPAVAVQQTADFVQILNKLSIFSTDIKAQIVTNASNKTVVVSNGKISSTPIENDRVEPDLAAYASVWWMQQPGIAFEALTTAAYVFAQL